MTRSAVVETHKDRMALARDAGYGRVSVASVFAGTLVAFGAAVLLLALASIVAAGTNISETLSDAGWRDAGTAGGIILAAALFLAYQFGGYSAGRMARRSGPLHGLLVFLTSLVAIAVMASVARMLTDASTDSILRSLRSVGVPTSSGEWREVATVAGIGSLIAMLAGSCLGGLLGERWHNRLLVRALDPDVGEEGELRAQAAAAHEVATDRFDRTRVGGGVALRDRDTADQLTKPGSGSAAGYRAGKRRAIAPRTPPAYSAYVARRAPRHHGDAGGPADLLAAKAAVRQEIWAALQTAGATRFPGPEGRIPNFVGAEVAAERLRSTDEWQRATTVKANPDSPQWPVRQRALEDGKTVFMAVPRLAEEHPFFLLDPAHLRDSPRKASSIRGASRSARTVSLDELEAVDLVVAGSVGVSEDGVRLGKGGGFSDLEFAVATAAGLIDPRTTVATTVHQVQVVAPGRLPRAEHDVPVDLIVTPDRVIHTGARRRREAAIRWDELTPEKVAAIPLLRKLRGG